MRYNKKFCCFYSNDSPHPHTHRRLNQEWSKVNEKNVCCFVWGRRVVLSYVRFMMCFFLNENRNINTHSRYCESHLLFFCQCCQTVTSSTIFICRFDLIYVVLGYKRLGVGKCTCTTTCYYRWLSYRVIKLYVCYDVFVCNVLRDIITTAWFHQLFLSNQIRERMFDVGSV